jgi:multiple sugar transport system permease protein
MKNEITTAQFVSRRKIQVSKWIVNFTLTFIAVIVLIPALWMIIAPSKDREGLVNLNPLAFGSFSSYITRWQNLLLFDDGAVLSFVKNSVVYTLAIVIISVLTSLMAGFSLAAINIRFKRVIIIIIMIAMIIPAVALIMPLFVWMDVLHLTDSAIGLILVSSLYPFGVFLSYIHFSTVVPRELYEAAKIDGCGYFRIFQRIGLPLSKGLIGLISFFAFTGAWNNFFLPQVLILSQEKHPLSSGLAILFTATPAFSGNSASILPIERSEIALSALLITVPVIILFLMSQRFLSRGMLAGAVK